MVKRKQKYYTVWRGHKTGVFDSWEDCQQQIKNYNGAQYKSFTTKVKAEMALKGLYEQYTIKNKATIDALEKEGFNLGARPNMNSICVDAASSGNPGIMEYRGVDTLTRKVLFQKGPFEKATNNIGEFLAIVHGLALLRNGNSSRILYTDSKTAISWVQKKKCNTKLVYCSSNKSLFELIARAESWLKNNSFDTKIVKWNTRSWGEIPADFGRK